MKKFLIILLLLINMCFFKNLVYASVTERVDKELDTTTSLDLAKNATSAIMIESSTGEVIFKKNENEKRPPASMTKMMSMLLIMEALEKGNITLEEEVTTSAYASSMGGSQIFLKVGEKMSINDMLKGIAIGSANDATVALAERIAGTEESFVKLMNDKAVSLGCKNTNFKNATGLDAENHYSTAYDLSLIAKELVRHKKILEYTKTYEDYLRKDTSSPFWLVNTNKLVRFYSSVDGLKTGFTKEAGYCLTSTAEKDNMRLITVVMNEPTPQIRNSETTSMLDYGFNMYSIDKLLDTNTTLEKVKVDLGKTLDAEIVPTEEVKILNSKTSDKRNVTYDLELNRIKAPVRKGDIVGTIKVYEEGNIINEIPATVKYDIDKASILTIYYRNFKNLMRGF